MDGNYWQGGFISAFVNRWVVRSGSLIIMVISWLCRSIYTPSKPLKSGRALLLWYSGYPTKFRHPKTDIINRLGEMHTKKVSFPRPKELTFLPSGHRSLHMSLYLIQISCGLDNPFATRPPLSQKTVNFPSFPDKNVLNLCLLDLKLTLYTSNLCYDAVCASSYAFSQQSLTEWNKETRVK